MLGGIETLVCEARLGDREPDCLDVVASACWVGFRLVRPPSACLENVVIGCARLPQFKDAARASLRRELRWHFSAKKVTAFHDTFGVNGWARRWREDAALRRTVTDHPAFGKWRDGLAASLARQPLVALAEEGGRSCYGAFGGDARTLAAMHGFMEEGGI